MNRRNVARIPFRWPVAVGALAALALSGCASGGTSSGSTPGGGAADKNATLRIGIDAFSRNFDPIQNNVTQGNYTLPDVYDQLVQLNDAFEPAAMLATSWEFNSDGTTLTMKLRTDAKFNGDNAPVNAAAVKASIERAKNDPKSLVAASLADVSEVTAVDDSTVKFTFAKPSYTFLTTLASDPRISSVVDPAKMDDTSLANAPAGSGPYTVGNVTQAALTLNRVDQHWDTTSGLAKTIQITAIADENARFNALKAGQIDMTFISGTQNTTAKQLTDSGRFQSFYEPKVQAYSLGVNGKSGSTLSDPTVRQALSAALDRTQFCSTAFTGGTSVATRQLVSPTNPVYDTSLDDSASLSAQADKAKSLLSTAGKSGLTLNMLTFGPTVTQTQIIQQQLAKAGITVNIKVEGSLAALLSDWFNGSADMRLLSQVNAWDPGVIVNQSVGSSPVSGGVPSYVQDALTTDLSTAPGDAQRQAATQVNKILTEQPVNIPMCSVGIGLIGTSKVTGLSSIRFGAFAPPFESRRLGLTS